MCHRFIKSNERKVKNNNNKKNFLKKAQLSLRTKRKRKKERTAIAILVFFRYLSRSARTALVFFIGFQLAKACYIPKQVPLSYLHATYLSVHKVWWVWTKIVHSGSKSSPNE